MSNDGGAFDGGGDAHFDGDGCGDASGADGGVYDGHDGIGDIQSNNTSIVEAGGLKIVTIRGIVAFLAVGGWTGFGLFANIGYWSILAGFVAGAAVAVLLAFLMQALMKLEDRGNLNYNRAIGATGTVYLNIPPERIGTGKITVMLQGRLIDGDAMTDDKGRIENGAVIKIVDVLDQNIFIVERV
jgi:membrane protein implicated in regulation of membrane protease activity